MSFDFNRSKQEAEAEAAEDKWDKARLYLERVTFCIRSIEEVDNPWYSKDTDPVSVFQLALAFVHRGHRQTLQTTYKITPEMRLMVTRHPTPWHNMHFTRYQTKQGSYGYELAQVTTDESMCPWELSLAERKQQPRIAGTAMQMGGDTVEGSLVEPAELLEGYAVAPFETIPCTDETYAALTKGSLGLKAMGVVVIPPEQDTLTEYAGRQLLVSMRNEWAQRSAGQAKSSL